MGTPATKSAKKRESCGLRVGKGESDKNGISVPWPRGPRPWVSIYLFSWHQPGDTLTFCVITTEFTHGHRVTWGTGWMDVSIPALGTCLPWPIFQSLSHAFTVSLHMTSMAEGLGIPKWEKGGKGMNKDRSTRVSSHLQTHPDSCHHRWSWPGESAAAPERG